MSSEEFKAGLNELYQGEIMGELVIEQMMTYFKEPAEQAKLAVLLQLETETKARLRPAVIELGLSLLADPATLAEGKAAALDNNVCERGAHPAFARSGRAAISIAFQ